MSGDLTRDRGSHATADHGPSVVLGCGLGPAMRCRVYNTISALAESPVDENVLYAGTDDGLDPGHHRWWRDLDRDTKPVQPARVFRTGPIINDFEPSRFRGRHGLHGDGQSQGMATFTPYLMRSDNLRSQLAHRSPMACRRTSRSGGSCRITRDPNLICSSVPILASISPSTVAITGPR